MLHALKHLLARRAMTLPAIGILAIAATACQGVGLSEARQAVDNQRAINEIEDREVRPIERELETLYENQILPRERELEDLWNQVQDLENGQFKDAYNYEDPWVPGGAADLLQQEFNAKYAEIDRLYRELEAESRSIQIEQQFSGNTYTVDPAVAALEDQRFSLQRELDRLHQFGRRPIEDIYLQMNELNASNGWSQTDIYAADELNRQIADIQNQIANAQSSGTQFSDQYQQELNAIEQELAFLRSEGFAPVVELKNRIAELQNQLAAASSSTAAGGNVNAAGVVIDDVLAGIEQLKAEMLAATEALRTELEGLNAELEANSASAQAEIDALLAGSETVTTPDPAVIDVLQAEIDSLEQQISDTEAANESAIAALDAQIADLDGQVGTLFQATDTAVAAWEVEIADLQAQIDALDTEAEDHADVKAGLESQIDAVQAQIDTAIADETTQVNALQGQIADLTAQKTAEQDNADGVIADLESQIVAKQAELDAANVSTSTTTAISQEVLDQIATIEENRDATANFLVAEIASVEAEIAAIEADYLAKIAELEQSSGAGSTTDAVPVDTTEIEFEIQTLLDQVFKLENDLNEKIRVLEEHRNKLQTLINDAAAGGVDIAALEAKLVQLHDQLNALQNSGIDASRNYNLRMEELQTLAVELEKELSLKIRAFEDQIWELDGRIAELYRSNNDSSFDPYAEFNQRLKEIELERFELEQRRWDIDDEQRAAFDQFNNFGAEQQNEVDAKRAEVLDPLYDRINVLEEELRELRLTQREIEDRLRDARRLADDQIRELEKQSLDLIDDALTEAEETADGLSALEDGTIEGLDPALLEGLDPSLLDNVGPDGTAPEAPATETAQ